MKIYAVQVPPEYQEPLLFDCFPDNIVVDGNRHYKSHTNEVFDTVLRVLESGELAEEISKIEARSDSAWYKNITEAVTDFLPPENGKGRYSTAEIHRLKECVNADRPWDNWNVCRVLSTVTGREWDYRTITGSFQGDWNCVFYPSDEWNNEALTCFEREYFNTGSEWGIQVCMEGEDEPGCAEEVEADFYEYCTSWGEEDIRREIAEACACDVNPEDVVMYEFTGWTKSPCYASV